MINLGDIQIAIIFYPQDKSGGKSFGLKEHVEHSCFSLFLCAIFFYSIPLINHWDIQIEIIFIPQINLGASHSVSEF